MVNTGDTAWVLVCAAMVLLMTPALALFYGGMVRVRSVLNMMMMSFGAMGVVSVLWVLYGYSGAFGDDLGMGLMGDPLALAGLTPLLDGAEAGALPEIGFAGFQAAFAILTVALISGAVAERMRFGPWLAFTAIWATVVYVPVAHWVFAFDSDERSGGWIANALGAIDFAGGTAVHINAGAAALALVLVLGTRRHVDDARPHSLPLVLLGAGLLWFGWFGFNAGSALAADHTAAVAWLNTLVAPAASVLSWLAVERLRDGYATSLGAASGVVAGLVAITPACSAVSPIGAVVIGLMAGVLCSLAIGLKFALGYDDSLDVVAVHLVGGLWGTLAVGLLGTAAAPAGVDGLLYGGGADQLIRQGIGAAAVLAYSFIVTWVLALILDRVSRLRVSTEDEDEGVDVTLHAERGYDLV